MTIKRDDGPASPLFLIKKIKGFIFIWKKHECISLN